MNTETPPGTFREKQLKYTRVREAYSSKEKTVIKTLSDRTISRDSLRIYLRAFKTEKKVEVWGKNISDSTYTLIKEIPICEISGEIGPKRRSQDLQVPEGFYQIAVFNPYSSYHLSLGINYPNASDKIIGKGNLGGDIMIHGSCVTIGCIPLTDTYIKEVYILAVEAKHSGQTAIPVHIFPTRLNEKGMQFLQDEFEGKTELLNFWKNLQPGFLFFENNKKLPKITIDKEGKYHT